jgi:hypothetical protein
MSSFWTSNSTKVSWSFFLAKVQIDPLYHVLAFGFASHLPVNLVHSFRHSTDCSLLAKRKSERSHDSWQLRRVGSTTCVQSPSLPSWSMEASSPLNESRYAYYKVNLDFLTKFVHLRASLSDTQKVLVYDKVNLDFLFELLELRGFTSKIISLITTIT